MFHMTGMSSFDDYSESLSIKRVVSICGSSPLGSSGRLPFPPLSIGDDLQLRNGNVSHDRLGLTDRIESLPFGKATSIGGPSQSGSPGHILLHFPKPSMVMTPPREPKVKPYDRHELIRLREPAYLESLHDTLKLK